MATSKAGTDLVQFDRAAYPLLDPAGAGSEMADILRENMGEEGMNAFDLDRVKMPSGGGQAWEIPGLDGDEIEKEIEGVIVAWTMPRSYWIVSLDEAGGGGNPPDCSSDDGTHGIGLYGFESEGNPSGLCAQCPMNEWGSAEKGNGKACKESRVLYMLLPGRVLPITVSLAPTSIQPIRKYLMRLAGEGVPYYGTTTKLGLEKVKGGEVPDYSVVVPKRGTVLDAESRAIAKQYGATLKESFSVRTQAALPERASTS